MTEHFGAVVKETLGHFGERITRVEAHLSAADGRAKSSEDKVHCVLEARLAGSENVVAKNHAGNAHQAIDGAVRKLHRAIDTQLGKLGPQVHRQPHHGLPDNSGDDAM
ncbi:HPF/RaiA family ribosome-associated protein [Paucibacter sp. R3-3]|uniref:HPF/RaiA family ribosome-associated protein n=1 Tax=Roseateles agri TaxID=3098619 RepID=A0ABU5DN40_9BURK|nr:HPF/RaiA family ribosome-associated protein [Paucibacter sp. R3-3]MDY0747703.1 HPF/RaiA family ribosome-associated protein [Paucibacter sp. R3-3]